MYHKTKSYYRPQSHTHSEPHIDELAPDLMPAKKKRIPEWLNTILVLLAALGLSILIISFVFRTYQVDGPSMESTLQNGDKLIIWKVPVTWSHITKNQYVPKRGDVIVFNQSGLSEFGQQDKKQLIKRVIGLPGERVVLQNGQYRVYNKQNPNGIYPDKALPYGGNIPPTSGNVDVKLDNNELFISGDNRPESLDSRSFGPINTDQVVGKLILRVLPIDKAKVF